MPDATPEHAESLHERFARSAERLAAREQQQREALRERLRLMLAPAGTERVLDAGTGTGALALALAPLVREVVAVDVVPELLDEARRQASTYPNVQLVQGDATQLGLESGSFDLAGCLRTLHHVSRPELVVAELTRVTRFGGRVLIVDQVASSDPLSAIELDNFERARDPSHTRTLPDSDIRAYLEANGLVLQRATFERELRDLEPYLDLAACEGESRRLAAAMAPSTLSVTVGWYLADKRVPA